MSDIQTFNPLLRLMNLMNLVEYASLYLSARRSLLQCDPRDPRGALGDLQAGAAFLPVRLVCLCNEMEHTIAIPVGTGVCSFDVKH